MNILEKGRGFIVKKWFQKTMSLLMCAAMLLSASSGVTPVLDEALVQEATPSEAECTHPNAHIVSFNKDAGVEQTYYFGLRLDEFGVWQLIELNATEVGEDTLVQK